MSYRIQGGSTDVPNVSSPLTEDAFDAGAKRIPTDAVLITPSERRLSVTVDTVPPADVVPSVRSVGPMLWLVRGIFSSKTQKYVPEDTVHAFKALRTNCSSNRLAANHEVGAKSQGVCGLYNGRSVQIVASSQI
jgi:hypothetical protein